MKHLYRVLLMTTVILAFTAIRPDSNVSLETIQQQRAVRAAALYRLNFTLRIFEGTAEQIRQFELILEERGEGKIRALTKVPVFRGDETTYIETGLKCDAQFQEIEGTIRLEMELVYSDIPSPAPVGSAPQVREWQSRVQTTVSPGQNTLLSSYDGGEDNLRYRFEVLAEKLR